MSEYNSLPVGEKLKLKRIMRKLSQADVAKFLGISVHTVSKVECGIVEPPCKCKELLEAFIAD